MIAFAVPSRIEPLRPAQRWLYAGGSVVSTLLWAASFVLCDSRQTLLPLAMAVGVAAAVAWLTLGLAVVLLVRSLRVWPWVDLCLRTQLAGMVLLGCSAAINVAFFLSADRFGSYPVFPAWLAMHLLLLLIADLLMSACFIGGAAALRLRAWVAGLLWVGVLNGAFVGVLMLIAGSEVSP